LTKKAAESTSEGEKDRAELERLTKALEAQREIVTRRRSWWLVLTSTGMI
jgi:hypothetical protein